MLSQLDILLGKHTHHKTVTSRFIIDLNAERKTVKYVEKTEHPCEREVGRTLKQNIKVLNHKEKKISIMF